MTYENKIIRNLYLIYSFLSDVIIKLYAYNLILHFKDRLTAIMADYSYKFSFIHNVFKIYDNESYWNYNYLDPKNWSFEN